MTSDVLFQTPGTYNPTPHDVSPEEADLGFKRNPAAARSGSKQTKPNRLVAFGVTAALLMVPVANDAVHWGCPNAPGRSESTVVRTTSEVPASARAEAADKPRFAVASEIASAFDADAEVSSIVERLHTSPDDRASVKFVLARFDSLLHQQKLGVCERVLSQVDVEAIGTRQALALLTATLPVRSIIASREAFFGRIRAKLLRDRPDDCEALLDGLA